MQNKELWKDRFEGPLLQAPPARPLISRSWPTGWRGLFPGRPELRINSKLHTPRAVLDAPLQKASFYHQLSHFWNRARGGRKPEACTAAWPGRFISGNLLKNDNTLAKINCRSLPDIFGGPPWAAEARPHIRAPSTKVPKMTTLSLKMALLTTIYCLWPFLCATRKTKMSNVSFKTLTSA